MIKVENPYPNEVDSPLLPAVAMADVQTMMHRAFDAGAKAQLKNVVEWGDEDCAEHAVEARKSLRRALESIGEPPIYPRRECHTCWQALIEEIK